MTKSAFEDQETWGPAQGVLKKESVPDVLSDTLVGDTSPGRVLQVAREASDVGLREMATRLNLSLEHLKALETNAFDKLPAPIYVRHYIKRYAEMLGISYEPLLGAYAAISENRVPNLSRVSISPQINKKSKTSHWIKYVLVIGLIIIALLLWQGGALLDISQNQVENMSSEAASVSLTDNTAPSKSQVITVIDLQNTSTANQD